MSIWDEGEKKKKTKSDGLWSGSELKSHLFLEVNIGTIGQAHKHHFVTPSLRSVYQLSMLLSGVRKGEKGEKEKAGKRWKEEKKNETKGKEKEILGK